jgi:hypothetical protein
VEVLTTPLVNEATAGYDGIDDGLAHFVKAFPMDTFAHGRDLDPPVVDQRVVLDDLKDSRLTEITDELGGLEKLGHFSPDGFGIVADISFLDHVPFPLEGGADGAEGSVHGAVVKLAVQHPTVAGLAGIDIGLVFGWTRELRAQELSRVAGQTEGGMSIYETGFQVGTVLDARFVCMDAGLIVLDLKDSIWRR